MSYPNNNFGGNKPRFNRKPSHGYKLNEDIRYSEVRITGDNIQSRICSSEEAIEEAKAAGLDLVEISADAKPPVVKVMDFQKFLYEKKRREKELKQQTKTSTKEIKLGPAIGDHDFDFKVKNSIKFLEEGHKVRAYIKFKGREIAHKENGELVLLKFLEAIEDKGRAEFLPKLEGRNMFVIIAPKKK